MHSYKNGLSLIGYMVVIVVIAGLMVALVFNIGDLLPDKVYTSEDIVYISLPDKDYDNIMRNYLITIESTMYDNDRVKIKVKQVEFTDFVIGFNSIEVLGQTIPIRTDGKRIVFKCAGGDD